MPKQKNSYSNQLAQSLKIAKKRMIKNFQEKASLERIKLEAINHG
jgi:hypothetical protein